MEFTLILFWGSLTIYATALLFFNFGANNRISAKAVHPLPSVSVIVAIHNGETSLVNLISDLQQQEYEGQFEIILVDDNSSDNTEQVIKNIVEDNEKFKYVHSSEGKVNLTLKKRALDAGIKNASFEILLFTDVDCRISKKWIKTMASAFKTETEYVIGLSKVIPSNSWISQFQSLDFQMLETASLGMAALGIPWACTGQNQAYRKRLFEEVGGFDKISNLLQGDDTLFLQLCRKAGAKTSYVYDQNSVVTSRTENILAGFLKQRMRWSGDAARIYNYNSAFFIMVIATFMLNGLICLIPIIGISIHHVIVGLFIKFIVEYRLYSTGIKLLSLQEQNIMKFFIWFVLQIPFVFLMGLSSFWAQQLLGWKNRKI